MQFSKDCVLQFINDTGELYFNQKIFRNNLLWITEAYKQDFLDIKKKKKELVGIDWSLLSSPSYTYAHCFSLIGDNFVSNCSRYMVQPFVLEILMSSFERYPS